MSNDQWPNHGIKPEVKNVTIPSPNNPNPSPTITGKHLARVEREQQELKSCPFCGSPCDDCRNEEGEGYLGCSNDKCAAQKLAMTDNEWNTRSTPSPTEPREEKKFTAEDVRQLVIDFSLVVIDKPMFEQIAEWLNERSK